jgi:hypothetical protein
MWPQFTSSGMSFSRQTCSWDEQSPSLPFLQKAKVMVGLTPSGARNAAWSYHIIESNSILWNFQKLSLTNSAFQQRP